MKIKKGDKVIVISGFYKGKTGTVQKAFPKTNKVVVDGINVRTKHQKPTQRNQEGSKIQIYAPIDASNVAIVDPKTKKATRVGYVIEKGQKIRIAKASKTALK